MTVLPAAAQSGINVSHDLVSLGIAGQNLTPDTPALDAQPLFNLAVQYAQANAVPLLTADPGAYYFLTSPNGVQYVLLGNVSNLTIDWRGSNLYIQDGMERIFELDYCQNVTLKNFTVDQLTPRYTQVQLTSIDPVQGVIAYTVPPGWADPATFTATALFGTPQLFAAFFRNGRQVAATGLAFITYPVVSPSLAIALNGEPWTQPAVLGTLQPGDMVAVWDRSGLESVIVDSSDSVTLSNIEIHGSGGGFAVSVSRSSNSIADNVRIKPRDGGLIASNADGIHFSFSLRNNHIRNCFVTRTTDDALAMDSDFVAAVASQPGPRQIVATRNFANRAANGSPMNFVSLSTTAETTGAVLISQDPPDSPDVASGGQVTLTFDRDLPTLSPGDEIVFANTDMRGGGSTIEDNVAEDIPVGRGMYLGGLKGVVIQRNVIRRTSNAGINVDELTVPSGGGGLPSHSLTIQNNVVENVLGPQASSAGGATVNQAAIVVSSADENFDFAKTPVNSNISIRNNYVAGSGRAGIWVGETSGGSVSGNVIVNWNQYPNLPVWESNPFPGDFAQPLVVRFSQGMATANNLEQMNSPLTGAVALSPASASLGGGASSGAFTVSVNVPDFEWAATSRASWLTVQAGSPGTGAGAAVGTGDGSVQFAVKANTTGAARKGFIVVAGTAFMVLQAAGTGTD